MRWLGMLGLMRVQHQRCPINCQVSITHSPCRQLRGSGAAGATGGPSCPAQRRVRTSDEAGWVPTVLLLQSLHRCMVTQGMPARLRDLLLSSSEGPRLSFPGMHLCRQHGRDKANTYARLGLWHPDFSLPARPKPGVSGSFAARPPPMPSSNTTASSNDTDAAVADKTSEAQPEVGGVQQAGQLETITAAGSMPAAAQGAVAALVRSPVNHPALAAAGMVLAVVGLVGCTTGLVLWRRSRAAGQHQHRLIKTIPMPPRAPAPASA